MSVVARFEVPATAFALGEALTVGGTVDVRLDTVAPLGQPLPPQVWVDSEHAPRVEAALDESALVDRHTRVGEMDGATLIAVEVVAGDGGFVDILGATDATVLDAACEDGRWALRIRFPDFTAVSTFYNRCVEADVSLDVRQVHDMADEGNDRPYGLTDQQRQTLRIALDSGYFAIPREATLMDLADELGISDTAASQRIRRGLAALVAATLE